MPEKDNTARNEAKPPDIPERAGPEWHSSTVGPGRSRRSAAEKREMPITPRNDSFSKRLRDLLETRRDPRDPRSAKLSAGRFKDFWND